MDTNMAIPQPTAPDLAARLRRLATAGVVAVGLLGLAAGYAAPAGAAATGKDPEVPVTET